VGGLPGFPYIRSEPATVGDSNALGAGPGPDLCGSRPGRGGGVIEDGFPGDGGDPVERSCLGLGPGVHGGEEPVGPLLGELAGLAENDRDVRPADLQFGEAVGDHRGLQAVELEMAE
jgi:hypothetical protein